MQVKAPVRDDPVLYRALVVICNGRAAQGLPHLPYSPTALPQLQDHTRGGKVSVMCTYFSQIYVLSSCCGSLQMHAIVECLSIFSP